MESLPFGGWVTSLRCFLMKNKLAKKLVSYFTASLLLFAVIVGGFFLFLSYRQTLDFHKEDLKKRAIQIAETLSQYMENSYQGGGMGHGMGHGMMGGLGSYLNFLDDVAMSDVWLVARDGEILVKGKDTAVSYKELSQEGDAAIQEAFGGNTTCGEGFSDLLGTQTITAATPVYDQTGEIVLAVLLHTPIEGIENGRNQGTQILAVSIAIAFFLSWLLAVRLSIQFIHPLHEMERTAKRLAEGDYQAKTGIQRQDEMGSLAQILDVLSERLLQASQEEENIEKMRQDFVSNISHELRTPITVIRGSLEAVCDGVVTQPDQVREYHLQMLKECVYLQRLVNDLLELSRLQNIEFKIEKEQLDFFVIVEDVVRSMRQVANKKEVKIFCSIEQEPCFILGDYGRLRQMLLIILDNAIKFSPNGGTITIAFIKEQGKCLLSVYDEGPGIEKELLPHLFDRFYKTKSEQNKSGTGLGLAIAKQIANRHEMALSAKNKEEKGTIVTLEFREE